MKATKVIPAKWQWDKNYPIRIIYDVDDYSIVWGKYEGKPALGARWNGEEETDRGYPGQGAYPTWHIEPDFIAEVILKKLFIMVKSGANENINTDNLEFAMKELNNKISNS